MHEIIKSTEIKDYDGGTYTRTTWTTGPHTLTAMQAGGTRTYWTVSTAGHDYPNIYENSTSWDGPVSYGVNWASMGTQTNEAAREYANKLVTASAVSEAFASIRNNH